MSSLFQKKMMTMKVNRVKVYLVNLDREEIVLSLPVKNSELRELLIAKKVVEANQSEVKHLDSPLKSVTATEIRHFTIRKPTNVYYLNSYFLFLKEMNLEFPADPLEITTKRLKELIADLLQLERNDMNLEEVYSVINSTNQCETKKTKNEKPIFSIRQLQSDNKERKRKRLEKTKE